MIQQGLLIVGLVVSLTGLITYFLLRKK